MEVVSSSWQVQKQRKCSDVQWWWGSRDEQTCVWVFWTFKSRLQAAMLRHVDQLFSTIVLTHLHTTSYLNCEWQVPAVPLSTCTSSTFLSRVIFRPMHSLQRSFGLMRSPCPSHSEHTDCICWMKPGPSCCTRTWIPVPRQVVHFSTAPALPPRPTHENNQCQSVSQ